MNVITTEVSTVVIFERAEGYEVVELIWGEYETLGMFQTMFAARDFVKSL